MCRNGFDDDATRTIHFQLYVCGEVAWGDLNTHTNGNAGIAHAFGSCRKSSDYVAFVESLTPVYRAYDWVYIRRHDISFDPTEHENNRTASKDSLG